MSSKNLNKSRAKNLVKKEYTSLVGTELRSCNVPSKRLQTMQSFDALEGVEQRLAAHCSAYGGLPVVKPAIIHRTTLSSSLPHGDVP